VGAFERFQDPVMAAVLAKLRADDPSAADDAEPALEWIAGEEGPDAITQERVQHFLWYSLPLKWLTELNHKLAIAAPWLAPSTYSGFPDMRRSADRRRRVPSSTPTSAMTAKA